MKKSVILMLVLLVATGPVAAVTATLVHTTDGDFAEGTTTNATVSGTGDSASVTWPTNVTTTLDGFEDGDIAEWTGEKTYYSASSSRANSGSHSMRFSQSGTQVGTYEANLPVTERQYRQVSFAFNSDNHNTNAEGIINLKSQGSDLIKVGWVSTNFGGGNQNLTVVESSGAVDTGLSYDLDQWYTVEISNIDYAAGTYDVTLISSSGTVGTYQDAEFRNAGNTVDNVSLEGEEATWYVDDIEAEYGATTGSYTSAEYDVTNPTNGFVDISSISNSEATVQWQYNTGSGWQTDAANTYSTAGNKSVALSTNAERWRVQVDFVNTSATNYYAEIAAEGVEFDNSAPALSGASPTGGAQVSTSPVTLEIDVGDGEFGTAQGDNVEVEFRDASDDSVIGTDTLTSAGTASVQWSDAVAGSNSWYAVATDSYGAQTTSSTHSFTTPSELYIRNETAPSELVNGSTSVTVRFYNDDTIIKRTTSDGTVDLAGLPQQQLVAVVETDDYYTRRVVIDSLYDQNSVYLLNKSETAVYNEFVTDDQTGRFDSATTRLYIEKAITRNNSTEWQVIAGDYLGASSSFPANLQQDARYRLSVENDDGDTRLLGAYTAAREGTVTLTIGAIEWQAPTNETILWETYLDGNGDIQIQFQDQQDQTTNFDVTVYERGNESNVIYQDSQASLGSYDANVSLTANQSTQQWVVEWSATRNGEQIGATNPIGGVSSLPLPVDSRWLTIGSLWLLVGFAALFPSTSARTGAVVVVAIAAGLSWMGWAPIPFVAVGLAGAIALLGKVADWRGDY